MARKILLADDSVTAQNMGRKILADAGYEVITVNNGSAALKKIAELRPDLVVLDVYMPGYSGLEVCQRLKESPETADMPVLLTVGKLEPFKPEEAQRVRANAFIVKPFEASELLSTLSKLEDKVVPRPEGAKTGRFARAVSRIEEESRKDEAETTWRDRIKFPAAKPAEPESSAASSPDDAALYNPVNRDLRTVVDRQAVEFGNGSETPQPVSAANLPADATPEELAALVAAASKLGIVESAPAPQDGREQTANTNAHKLSADPIHSVVQPSAEAGVTAAPVAEVEAHESAMADADAASQTKEEVQAAASQSEITAASADQEVQTAIASLSPVDSGTSGDEVTATMAAATHHQHQEDSDRGPHREPSQEPHWAAVAVAPTPDEAALSLEAEMEKVLAAVASATATAECTAELTSAGMEAEKQSLPESVSDSQVSATTTAEPEHIVSSEHVASSDHVGSNGTQPHSAAIIEAVSEQPVALADEPPAQASSVSEPVASPSTAQQEAAASAEAEATPESAGQAEPPQLPMPQQQEAALAVAAGAERLMEDAKAAAPGADPYAIASIVESVMAELRPKLVEEITRKLAAERK